MPEVATAQVEVSFDYACDKADGGFLYFTKAVFDQQGGVQYEHTCTNHDDPDTYRFDVKYPYRKFVNVNINGILA